MFLGDMWSFPGATELLDVVNKRAEPGQLETSKKAWDLNPENPDVFLVEPYCEDTQTMILLVRKTNTYIQICIYVYTRFLFNVYI